MVGSRVMTRAGLSGTDLRRTRASGVPAPPLPLGQNVEGSLGRRLVREGLDQAGPNGAGSSPAAHQIAPAEKRRLEGERIEPPHAPVRVDAAQVDEVRTGSRHREMLPARERKGNPGGARLRLG